MARPWRLLRDGVAVSVRVTPKAGRDQIDGIGQLDDKRVVLKVRVRAAPADGEANEALARLLARAAGVAPTAVKLLQGAAGRRKALHIAGDPVTLAAALERAAAGDMAKK